MSENVLMLDICRPSGAPIFLSRLLPRAFALGFILSAPVGAQSLPVATSSSALSIAAPAAPRTVLWLRATKR